MPSPLNNPALHTTQIGECLPISGITCSWSNANRVVHQHPMIIQSLIIQSMFTHDLLCTLDLFDYGLNCRIDSF